MQNSPGESETFSSSQDEVGATFTTSQDEDGDIAPRGSRACRLRSLPGPSGWRRTGIPGRRCRSPCNNRRLNSKPIARPELDHGVVGTDAVAIVALEAVAAGQAAPRLVERIALVEALDHLLEGRGAARHFQHRPQRLGRFAVIPGVELVGGGDLVLRRPARRFRRAARHRYGGRPSCRGPPRP